MALSPAFRKSERDWEYAARWPLWEGICRAERGRLAEGNTVPDPDLAALDKAILHLDAARHELAVAVVHFHAARLHRLGDFCDRILKTVQTLKEMDPRKSDDREGGERS